MTLKSYIALFSLPLPQPCKQVSLPLWYKFQQKNRQDLWPMLWFRPQSRNNENLWEARLSRPNPGKGSPITEASEQSALLLGLFGRCWQAVSSAKTTCFPKMPPITKHGPVPTRGDRPRDAEDGGVRGTEQ